MKKTIKRSEVKLGEEFEWGGGRYIHIEPHIKYGTENHTNDTLILHDLSTGIKGQTTKWLDNNVDVTVERKVTFADITIGENFTLFGRKYTKLDRDNLATRNSYPGLTVVFDNETEVNQ